MALSMRSVVARPCVRPSAYVAKVAVPYSRVFSPAAPMRPTAPRKVVVRAVDPKDIGKDISKATKDLGKDIRQVTGTVQGKATQASQSIQDAASKLDLSQLVRYNFFAQVVLAASSWGIMFFTTHATIAAGAKVGPGTIILMLGTLLSGYSAYLAYSYFSIVQSGGTAVLAGWDRMKSFYDHITFNFVGAGAAVLALQATVGVQVMGSLAGSALKGLHLSTAPETSQLGLQFLMQAAANTLLAHIVSILFLVLLLKKTTDVYKPLVELADKLKATMGVA